MANDSQYVGRRPLIGNRISTTSRGASAPCNLAGEIHDAAGDLTEIRPTGSFVEKAAGGAPHTEGGGERDCIAWFSNRGTDGMIYEILGPNNETVATLGLLDFKALLEAQDPPVIPTVPG